MKIIREASNLIKILSLLHSEILIVAVLIPVQWYKIFWE